MKFTLQRDTMTPGMRSLLARCKRPAVVVQAGAKAVQVAISQHLRALQARPNQSGFAHRRFFAGRPDSVERNVGTSRLSPNEAVVSIADPRFVHRIKGGLVRPKRAKNIAIPLTEEANRASGKGSIKESLPGLRPAVIKGNKYLVRDLPNGKVEVLFRLKPWVLHSEHPEELPPQDELIAAADRGFETAARRLVGA